MNKILLLSLFYIASCGQVVDKTSIHIEDVPEKPEITQPKELVCNDFNANNNKSLAPCDCPLEYNLSLSTTECIDKQEIPLIKIQVQDSATILHKTWQNAVVTIDADAISPDYSVTHTGAQVRGRGNSTWEFPKKPYRFKLATAQSVLGLPAHKDWVLLANYSDKTLMRVMLANEMGRRLGKVYAPRYKVVEVEVNGNYRGTYLLTEQIKINKNRVDIKGNTLSGGYIVELDQYKDGDYLFTSNSGIPFTLKEPDPASQEQMDYIEGYFNQFESILFSHYFDHPTNGYSSMIDVDSFVDWYLINEILKNSDAGNWSSVYYHKSDNEKLKMGPIWDFDTAIGNNNYTLAENPEGWWIRTQGIWFNRLFDDPNFEQKVINRWKELPELGLDLDSIIKFINQKQYSMELTQTRNFAKWDILNIYVWPNPIVTGTYSGEVDYLKQWITTRMNWIKNELE